MFIDPEHLKGLLREARTDNANQADTIAELQKQVATLTAECNHRGDLINAHVRGVDLFNKDRAAWKAERAQLLKACDDREWLANYFEQATADMDVRLELVKAVIASSSAVTERACAQLVVQKPVIDAARALFAKPSHAHVSTRLEHLASAIIALDSAGAS